MNLIIVSGLTAALAAIGITVAIERFGGRRGGILGTVPTTIIPAAVGLYLISGGPVFQRAMAAIPAGILVNAIFLLVWKHVALQTTRNGKSNLIRAISVSLSAWILGAICVVWILHAFAFEMLNEMEVALTGPFALVFTGLVSSKNSHPSPIGTNTVKLRVLLARGSIAGIAISCCVWVGSMGYPITAGIISIFPAIFLTTMVSLSISQHQAVPIGAIGPMILGSSSVAAYAVFVMWTYPYLGLFQGTVTAWLFAVLAISAPAWWWVHKFPSQSKIGPITVNP